MSQDRIHELTKLDTELKRDLGLFGAVSIIGGIMIGSGIFFIGSFVLQRSHMAPGFALMAWVAGGVVSLLAGLCYAELGAAMPRAGGAYVYLREAYGPIVAFLLGWTDFWVALSGSISALAVGFATYFSALYPMSDMEIKGLAIGVIILLTTINCFGVKFGGMLQNVFMVAKMIPLVLIIIMGIAFGTANNGFSMSPGTGSVAGSFALALIASLWAFDGWNNINIVAEEIKNPRRNIPLAMIIAIGGVTVIYFLFNYALLNVLPAATIAADPKPGAAAAVLLMGVGGGLLVAIGACVSIFGSCNGCVLAFPRAYYAMAKDGVFFNIFAKVHPKYRTPIPALIGSAVVAILLIFTGTFEQLATMVVFAAWIFYTLTIGSLFILRKKYPDMERPYKVWGYPILPIVALLVALLILGNTLVEDPRSSLIGLVVPLLGVPVYYFFRNKLAASVDRDSAA